MVVSIASINASIGSEGLIFDSKTVRLGGNIAIGFLFNKLDFIF